VQVPCGKNPEVIFFRQVPFKLLIKAVSQAGLRYAGGIKMVKGFKMKLYEGQEAEYERRHNLLWPEMKDMIHEHGGKNYTIFLDKETLTLFGYIEIEDEELWAKGADTAINRKWWDYMADIMETNPDNSPVSIDLQTVFHLD
jgi:L-rhamnose mutarotase